MGARCRVVGKREIYSELDESPGMDFNIEGEMPVVTVYYECSFTSE